MSTFFVSIRHRNGNIDWLLDLAHDDDRCECQQQRVVDEIVSAMTRDKKSRQSRLYSKEPSFVPLCNPVFSVKGRPRKCRRTSTRIIVSMCEHIRPFDLEIKAFQGSSVHAHKFYMALGLVQDL
jgi:hypothetical protein